MFFIAKTGGSAGLKKGKAVSSPHNQSRLNDPPKVVHCSTDGSNNAHKVIDKLARTKAWDNNRMMMIVHIDQIAETSTNMLTSADKHTNVNKQKKNVGKSMAMI